MRTLRIALVKDRWWLGRDAPSEVLQQVSKRWADEFGIALQTVRVHEVRVPGWTSQTQLERAARDFPITPDVDIVMLWTTSTGVTYTELAEVLGNYVLIAPSPVDSAEHMVSHALGHVFGATHRATPTAVMAPLALPGLATAPLTHFAATTRRTILANRWRSFDRRYAFADRFESLP